jgi:hypothetical protein
MLSNVLCSPQEQQTWHIIVAYRLSGILQAQEICIIDKVENFATTHDRE